MKKYFLLLMMFIPCLVYADNRVINGNDFDIYKRSKADIYERWQIGKIDNTVDVFTSLPSYTAPYVAGVTTDEYLNEVVENLNYYRYLVGVPGVASGITNDEELQTAEVIQTLYVEKNQALTHYLYNNFPKPDDMSQEFYNLGAYANHSVISYGRTDEPNFYFFDESIYDEGYPETGHRMALLSPEVGKEEYGIGENTIYGRSTNNRSNYSNMQSFAAYPSPGYFPKQDFADISDWDIFLNIDNFKYLTEAEQKNVRVIIRNLRTDDEYIRSVDAGNLNFDYECYNNACTIYNRMNILQPDKEAGTYYNDSYEVIVKNLIDKQGNFVDLKYTVNFYDKYENAELAIENVYFDLDLNTFMLDGNYTINSFANGSPADGATLLLKLEENNEYEYTPSSYTVVSQGMVVNGIELFYAYPTLDDLPKNIKDTNDVLKNTFYRIYACSTPQTYRFQYSNISYEVDEGDTAILSVQNFYPEYDGSMLQMWMHETDGGVDTLNDPNKYATNGLQLAIQDVSEEDSGNYYLTTLLMSEEYMSIFYMSLPIHLEVKGEHLKGDMNSNGRIDLSDVIILLRKYLSGDITSQDLALGDMDSSGSIGLNDIIQLLRTYLLS